MKRLFLTLLFLLCASVANAADSYSNAWKVVVNRPETVQLTTDNGLTTIIIGAGTSIQTVLKSSGEATFAWDASEAVDGYYLYCTGPTEIKQQTVEPTVTITLEPGTYKCWATAYRGEVESGPSNGISVKIMEVAE